MKKLVYLIMFLPLFSFGQTIPNASFETWVSDTTNFLDPNAIIPDGWQGTTIGGGVSRVSNLAANGNFAVEVKEGNFFGSPLPGAVFCEFPSSGVKRAFLNGYFRKTGAVGDTLIIGAAYMDANDDTTMVYGGANGTARTTTGWQAFSIPLSELIPNRVIGNVLISVFATGAGSGFQVDALSLSDASIGPPLGTDIISPIRNRNKVARQTVSARVYPSPAVRGKEVKISLQNVQKSRPASVKVVNILGEAIDNTLLTMGTNGSDLTLQTATLTQGIYKIVVSQGEIRSSQTLIIR